MMIDNSLIAIIDNLYCIHCGIKYDSVGNHPDLGTGHWEEHDDGTGELEIWYCCHHCRDNNEPCESFFKMM